MHKPLLTTLLLLGGLAAPLQAQLGPPPFPPENPITEPKRILGKALFWEEQLSSDSTVSCGTCHFPSAGGSDPRTGFNTINPGPDGLFATFDDILASPGVALTDVNEDYEPHPAFGFKPQITGRMANPATGAAHFDELFWDGRASSAFVDPETGQVSIVSGGALESQAVGPIISSVEMASPGRTWGDVRRRLESVRPLALAWNLTPDLVSAIGPNTSYQDLFQSAFGDPAINAERIAFALATYQRTLNPDDTPWDRFQNGQTSALTSSQIQGMNIFNGSSARCSECHPGPLFSDGSYRNLGIRPISDDAGRMDVTGLFEDRGKFKVPGLRNAALRTRLFHNGSANGLITVMIFYDGEGGPFPDNKDSLMNGLSLPTQSRLLVEEFIFAGLTDARAQNELPPFDRPRLNSERPFPAPILQGGEINGSGGFAPKMLALDPSSIGNSSFKLGLHNALGGAAARLVWYASGTPPMGGPAHQGTIFPHQPIVLSGAGPGQGYGTWHRPIPMIPALVGTVMHCQWFIADPAAPRGMARSEIAQVEFF